MATNVVQGNLAFDKLFKNAKKFYGNSNNKKKEDLNVNNDGTGTSVAIADSELPNNINNNNNNKNRNSLTQETKQNDETPVLNKFRNFMKRNKSKDVEDSRTFENVNPEIRSDKESMNEVVKDSNENSGEGCRQEDCKNYALSNSLNSEKLKEIINDSIKAAVENLANDVKPPCWKEDNEEESVAAVTLESPCFNDTCPQRNKTVNNKDNVTSSIQAVVPLMKSKTSGNICSIYENKNNTSVRDSKRSYNSNKNSSQRQLPTSCCLPSSKSGTTSTAVCHQSVSKYNQQRKCCCNKRNTDKSSKSSSKPCKLLKTDNRRMTGNVNIYICSEGNDGGGGKNKKNNKNTESTCLSTTATNASCDCSSTEVCACQSSTSSKTIRNLMTKNKNENNKTDDINLNCACGKPPTDCQCQSKNPENEELCLCDMSSLNPTTSVETLDYNLNSPKNSESSPHGDYCANRIRSRSSSRHEHERECCTGQNFVSRPNLSNCCIDNVDNKSKLTKYDSGNGDAVKDCSNCDTFSDYSDNKLNHCNCNCDGNVTNPSSRNQSERYVIQNIVNYGARRDEQQQPCNCCKYDNESLCSSGKKSEIDESVCCKKKEYCRKSYSPSRSIAYDSNNRQRWRNSDYCIVEEENEECDPSCCKFFTPEQENLKSGSNSQKASWTPCGREESSIRDKKEEYPSSEKDNARISTENGRPPSQNVATRMSVDEVVKSFSNVDKSTSSIFFSLNSSNSPPSSPSKPKESKKSSLKWSFSKAKSLISGKSTTGDIETKNKSPITDTTKLEANVKNSVEPVKDEIGSEKITNGKSSSTVGKSTAGEKSASANGGDSLITIKSSNDGEAKSKESVTDNNKKTKLSSSKLGSMIADRKNSLQSATNETSRSYEDNKSNGTCKCGAVDADMCTCQYPHCRCCNRPEEYCKCDDGWKNRKEDEKSCKVCRKSKQLCCCSKQHQEIKNHRTLTESENFRVCTLCCKAEKNCCCNNFGGQSSSRRSRTPSNLCNRNNNNLDSYESDGRKSQICIYCERPREKCSCRAPVKKCSYCGMPVDVCNCQDIEATCNGCNYEGNRCQCKGRLIDNSDGGDQSICVTAWKPRREIRKYFSRNPGERDSPDCSCCETVRPYGSDELPYQRLSVFSDVMTELQQKMNEMPSCNRCEKIPCCCYVQEKKSYSSPLNENRIMCNNSKQRKSRSKSRTQCRNCLSSNPCKCGTKKNSSSYEICDRCRTTPCRCRKSRSTHRKPQAKCYYCKLSPCRCESIKTAATPKGCRCSVSPARSEDQSIKLIRDKTEERNFQNSRLNKNSCRCRCGSPSYGSSSLRGQERRCG